MNDTEKDYYTRQRKAEAARCYIAGISASDRGALSYRVTEKTHIYHLQHIKEARKADGTILNLLNRPRIST